MVSRTRNYDAAPDYLRQNGKPLWERNDFRRDALIAVAMALLKRQIQTLADAFENEGGFTERLYRIRSQKRQ